MSYTEQTIAFGHVGFFGLLIKEVYQEKYQYKIWILLKSVIKQQMT